MDQASKPATATRRSDTGNRTPVSSWVRTSHPGILEASPLSSGNVRNDAAISEDTEAAILNSLPALDTPGASASTAKAAGSAAKTEAAVSAGESNTSSTKQKVMVDHAEMVRPKMVSMGPSPPKRGVFASGGLRGGGRGGFRHGFGSPGHQDPRFFGICGRRGLRGFPCAHTISERGCGGADRCSAVSDSAAVSTATGGLPKAADNG